MASDSIHHYFDRCPVVLIRHDRGILEARELIQRVTKLPLENFELMRSYEGNVLGESLSGMINQENILLSSQAVELIRRYPDSFSSTEYFAVAFALSQSGIQDDLPYLFENAIDRARNANDYNVSARAYAAYFFSRGDYAAGRRMYEKALSVWNEFPERNLFLVHSTDLVTLMYWSNAELSIKNHAAASELIARAKARLANLPPGPVTSSLHRQVADVEARIENELKGPPGNLPKPR